MEKDEYISDFVSEEEKKSPNFRVVAGDDDEIP